MRHSLYCLILLGCLFWQPLANAQKGEFLTLQQLHQLAFADQPMQWQTLWVNQQQREIIENILGHNAPALRIRYWGQGSKTAWIFEEIGKELPITVGVIVNDNAIEAIKVMNYRESRGGEVRHPFFTDQFRGAALTGQPANPTLNAPIDGITGATLSVRALKKIATLALFCHTQTPFNMPEKP